LTAEEEGSEMGNKYESGLEYIRAHGMPDAETFDWAVPLEQFKRVCDTAGQNVSGRVVTAYGDGVFGRIVGLDDEASGWVAQTFAVESSEE